MRVAAFCLNCPAGLQGISIIYNFAIMEIIYNGTIINEGKSFHGFLLIDGCKIALVGQGDPDGHTLAAATVKTNAGGGYIVPGVIDDHVHFREPGMTQKADIASESRAAVAGGVTSFMDMPNNKPAATTAELLEAKYAKAALVSPANYSFWIGATNDNLHEIEQTDFSRVCGVKAFLGSSTGGMLLSDPAATRNLFSSVGTVIAVHSEDEDIINANRKLYVDKYGQDPPLRFHEMIRSAEACWQSTSRAVKLARECGTRLHVLHITTARELSLFDGGTPLRDKRITAEACVAHLWFCDDDYNHLGTRIKCNPAVKTAADRAALRQALTDGRIDVIGTDHAPHLMQEKQGGCLKAASGMPMMQFSLPAMLELAHQGVVSKETVIDKMAHAPATLFGIEGRGFLRKGYYADVAIVKPVSEGYVVTDADVISRCGWTPLNGSTLHHKVVRTYVNGQVAFDGRTVSQSTTGMRLTFKI